VVNVTDTAREEAERYAGFIQRRSNDDVASHQWWNGLLDAILSLESLPARCPRIPEQDNFDFPLHQLLYASHRIIFRIDAEVVRVLRVYPAAARPLRSLNQRPRRAKLH
jgi:plasmid stabilization system protein ParE